MLLCCPKCNSVYEIPDDLIGKTGKKFRCQACGNIWHALRSDALGYEPSDAPEPLVEPLKVKVPPYRKYPSDLNPYIIPADTKPGRKTRSSKEVKKDEGIPGYVPPAPHPAPRPHEITLTSDHGTSFTISMAPEKAETPNPKTPHLFSTEPETPPAPDIRQALANVAKKEEAYKPSFGLKAAKFLLFLCAVSLALFAFRREIVTFLPASETYYNKIGLSGENNAGYLRFGSLTAAPAAVEGKEGLKVIAKIKNNSPYRTRVPQITASGTTTVFTPKKQLLAPYEETEAVILLKAPAKNEGLTFGFKKP